MSDHALDGVTILDLTEHIAGPYCTKLLADYGADVIKIEKPGKGDIARGMGPFLHDAPDLDLSGLFLHLNTNKRSITLDLTSSPARKALLSLVREADIIVEDFAPGTMVNLGLGYDILKQANPSLVMTSISGFGQTGPYKNFKSTEIVTYALGGPMFATGLAWREPVKAGGNVVQYHAGANAAAATAIALWGAEVTGQGDHLDISLMRVQASNQDRRSTMLIAYQYTGEITQRTAQGGTRLGAGIRPCGDGYVALGADGPRFERGLTMMRIPELSRDPRFSDPAIRATPQGSQDYDQYLLPWLLQRTKQQVFQEAQAAHVPAGPLNTTADLLADQNFRDRGFWANIYHTATGALKYPGRPFIMAETPWAIRRPAPKLGEHNREILGGKLGMTALETTATVVIGSRARPTQIKPRTPTQQASNPQAVRQPLPLEGIRVLSYSVVWAGPHACQILADWGAQVIRAESIKVLQPNTRARTIKIPPNMPPQGWGTAYPGGIPGNRHWNRFSLFQSHARNKLGMTVDVQDPEGREIFNELLRISDVFIENNVPQTMEKIGLTYEQLVKVKPDLIGIRMPAYGLTGPYKNYRSFGSHLEGTAGHTWIRGYADMDPSAREDSLMGDAAGGVCGALAVMLGLRHLRRTGKGQLIELSQVENFLPYIGEAIMDYSMNGRVHGTLGNGHPFRAPQGAYRCIGEDRWIAISIGTEEEWRGLSQALGHPKWSKAQRFATGLARWKHQEELDRHVNDWTQSHAQNDAMHILQKHGVPAGAILDDRNLYEDPHMAAQGFFEELTQEDCGTHRYPGLLWTAAETPNKIRLPPVRLGEHNEWAYKELLGVSAERYRHLERDGQIGMDYPDYLD